MSSQRLPGKMMMRLNGRPLLGRVIDRLRQSKSIAKVIVATSDHSSDDPLAQYCTQESITCERGPLDDVSERFRCIVEAERSSGFVRICGDSPLIDPALIDQATNYFQQGDCDLVTNVLTRTFPKGQSVEVVSSDAFLEACKMMKTQEQREHVTRYFYDHTNHFRIVSFTSGSDLGDVNLSVDTAEDFSKIELLLDRCDGRISGWRDLVRIYKL